MKTISYNPSSLEVEFATIIESLKDQMNDRLQNRKINSIEHQLDSDNPHLFLNIEDNDGDRHKLVMMVIQKPDELI